MRRPSFQIPPSTALLALVLFGAGCDQQCEDTTVTAAPSTTSTIANATTYVIGVQGMHCGGCANAIATKAGQVEGVASCDVSFEDGTATVVVAPESIEEVESAITTLGYTITSPATPADAATAG